MTLDQLILQLMEFSEAGYGDFSVDVLLETTDEFSKSCQYQNEVSSIAASTNTKTIVIMHEKF